MKVSIGSLNGAKNTAVRNVINKIWPNSEYYSVKTESNVSEQPKSAEEAIEGAINRAKSALGQKNSDLGIGLEGTVETNRYGMFLYGWVAIVDKNEKIGLGSSGKVLVPEWMKNKIDAGEEMGPIMQEFMKDKDNNIRHTEGTSGLLTKGMYSRIHEFEDAVMCALSVFLSSEFYDLKDKLEDKIE
ncbi:MAG: DUF84 family protein [Nanoarchaeota archaeon]